LVTRGETISPTSIAQARLLLASNDPRRLRAAMNERQIIPGGVD
jgi:hypothetical protein